jgi:hypothetical protein
MFQTNLNDDISISEWLASRQIHDKDDELPVLYGLVNLHLLQTQGYHQIVYLLLLLCRLKLLNLLLMESLLSQWVMFSFRCRQFYPRTGSSQQSFQLFAVGFELSSQLLQASFIRLVISFRQLG